MAKKRKKTDEEKEEKEYRPQEFDEREFIAEEINVARAVILGAIISIPMGIAAFFLTVALGTAAAGLVIAVIGVVLIKFFMPIFKVEEGIFLPKHWLSVISTYFFAFLAVWLLMFNPPFSDYAAPQISELEVSSGWEVQRDCTMASGTNYTLRSALIACGFEPIVNGSTFTIDDNTTDDVAITEANITMYKNFTGADSQINFAIVSDSVGQAADLNMSLGGGFNRSRIYLWKEDTTKLIENSEEILVEVKLRPGAELTVRAVVTDNSGDPAFVNVNHTDSTNPMTGIGNDTYTYSFMPPANQSTITVFSEDEKGNVRVFEILLRP